MAQNIPFSVLKVSSTTTVSLGLAFEYNHDDLDVSNRYPLDICSVYSRSNIYDETVFSQCVLRCYVLHMID